MQTNAITRWRNPIAVLISMTVASFAQAQAPEAPPQAQPGYSAPPAVAAAEEPPLANEAVVRLTASRTELNLVEKFAKVVTLDSRIARVDGFDPDVITVSTLPQRPNQIRVLGSKPGVTTMVLVDEHDKLYSVDVFVTGDVRHLQAYIDRLFPRASVEAVPVRDSVVLRGWVEQPEHITELVEVAQQFSPKILNQMKVGAVQQVLLKVKVMEVQRSKIRALGVNWNYVNDNVFLSSTPGGLVPLASATAVPGGTPALGVSAASLADTSFAGGFVNDNSALQVFVDALKEESLLKILAEPTLVATNGHPAQLLSGGEFPILVPQGLQSVTIEYREFGVRLEAVPTILGGGRVRLELQPEVSERDFTNSVSIGGLLVPGLTTRRVNTQVEMRYGETFVLAGLLSQQDRANAEKIPFFGELPWIGTLFSRKRYDQAETEVVIMVTPELVGPIGCEEMPPGGPGRFSDAPTDRELYHSGYLEVPYYGEHCGPMGCAPNGMGAPFGLPGTQLAPAAGEDGQPVETLPPATPVPDSTVPDSTVPSSEPSAETGGKLRQRARALFQPAALTPEGQPHGSETPVAEEPKVTRSTMIETKPGLITPAPTPDPFAP
jgi:pilus assembly protein CpaC